MKENKNRIVKALTVKHLEMIEATKLNTVKGGIVVCEDAPS